MRATHSVAAALTLLGLVFLATPAPATYTPYKLDPQGNVYVAPWPGGMDAFGRTRTAQPRTLFESQNQYDTSTILWDQSLTGTGNATHLPNESSVSLSVAASGDKVIRQRRTYNRYHPGKSQLVQMTFTLGAATTNVRRRVGYFDANNGIFVEQTGTGLSIVRRTSVTGSPVDNPVAQASWSIDPLNGSGPSRITLDPTKAQILVVDFQWLGAGRVRVGFSIAGLVYYVHEFDNANSLATVYMTTADLPLRYELEATGVIGATHTLTQTCGMVASEGGIDEEHGYCRSANTGTASYSVTIRRPIISIRPSATFRGITNRADIVFESNEVAASGNSCLWEIVYNGTLTGASFSSVGTNSVAEVDTSATAITGGDVILSGFCAASNANRGSIQQSLLSRLPLTLDISGANPINLTLVVTSLNATSTVNGCLCWREFW